jgi:predicted O-linked N-acetylglucosamine transferase (SPINDLY family)
VDAVLDPMPYGGANGTLEALAMNVPVVTLVGKRHAERTSYSMLRNLGVESTIASSGPKYVEIVERLARDPAFMARVREQIRAGVARSVLTDRAAHTRAFEQACELALSLATSTASA